MTKYTEEKQDHDIEAQEDDNILAISMSLDSPASPGRLTFRDNIVLAARSRKSSPLTLRDAKYDHVNVFAAKKTIETAHAIKYDIKNSFLV